MQQLKVVFFMIPLNGWPWHRGGDFRQVDQYRRSSSSIQIPVTLVSFLIEEVKVMNHYSRNMALANELILRSGNTGSCLRNAAQNRLLDGHRHVQKWSDPPNSDAYTVHDTRPV